MKPAGAPAVPSEPLCTIQSHFGVSGKYISRQTQNQRISVPLAVPIVIQEINRGYEMLPLPNQLTRLKGTYSLPELKLGLIAPVEQKPL